MLFRFSLFLAAGIMVFSIASTPKVIAATYYVATIGNDNNSGSAAQPWRTLQKAVNTASAGDTIQVRSGTYAGCRIERSGRAEAVCTLQAEPGAVVVINTPGPNNRHSSLIEIENFDAEVRYWVIDGFEVAESPRYGVDIRVTDYITVRRCNVHDSRVTGIFLAFSYHPLIEQNESANNGEHGIYQSNSGDFPIIRANNLRNNASAGLHMNGDRNFTPGDGIISFATVEKNVIWGNGRSGASGINCDGVNDSIIRNNLLYDNHASGISLYAVDGAQGSSRNLVYNNTIVMAPDGRWCINIPASSEGQTNPAANRLANNILYTAHSFRGSVSTYSRSAPGFDSDYNIVVGRFSTDDGDTNMTLAAWQSLGYDRHSAISTPSELFANVAVSNYHLHDGALAVDAGLTLTEVQDDLDGRARPQGRSSDIGCYEVGGSQPPEQDSLCTSAIVETGKFRSGGHFSLHAADGDNLVIKAVKIGGTFGTSFVCSFDTGLTTLSTMSITVQSRPKLFPQRQVLELFNVPAAAWETVDTRNLFGRSGRLV
ncbi:MAG TPA: right-handed parallel beta-helix repeat-containing protein [Blastocatellia bacterium]|nr:right-handed parallel beta-helix repeat-containing protein [Blastocatellia bacterium]